MHWDFSPKVRQGAVGSCVGANSEGSQAKPDREQRPDDAPPGTKDIDKDKRVDRGLIHDIKKRIGAKDWVGISPDGTIWINEGGKASEWGHISDWDRSDKPGKRP